MLATIWRRTCRFCQIWRDKRQSAGVATLTSDEVQALYPMALRWAGVRKQFDPQAKFMNAHLRELFAFSL